MRTENRSEGLGNVEKVVSGNIVDSGAEHLTLHDAAAGEDITVRIDPRTRFTWLQKQHEGRLTDTAQVRVGFYIAGGIHSARDVIVLDPGNGSPIADRLIPTVH
ncbi:MAG: hypothetical protein L0Y66_18875 [Myxococcaceae bacterium]|nr:hypothetical protein [Myxococcaceae bacterium]MCI0671384.1 hypothetical protein [Myxococcaceae bacterium]